MCVAYIEGKGFRADASDVAAGINTGFFVRFGKLGIDIDNITLVGNGKAAAICTGCADTDFGFDKAAHVTRGHIAVRACARVVNNDIVAAVAIAAVGVDFNIAGVDEVWGYLCFCSSGRRQDCRKRRYRKAQAQHDADDFLHNVSS